MPSHIPGRWFLCAVLVLVSSAHGSIVISLNFPGGNPFTVDEMGVINHAKGIWESAIIDNGGQQVNVDLFRSSLAQGLLGFASNYTTTTNPGGGAPLAGTPTGGRIDIDDRLDMGEQPFFVDTTPGDNSEFSPGNTPFHFTPQTGGTIQSAPSNEFDLLSVMFHELGHVLGFSSSFQDFAANLTTVPADNNRDVYVFNRGVSPIGPAGIYSPGPPPQFVNGAVYMKDDQDLNDAPGSGAPSHIDESGGPGAMLAGYFPFDLMNPTLALGERRLISNVDLDILADAHGYQIPEPASLTILVGLGAWMARRRQLG